MRRRPYTIHGDAVQNEEARIPVHPSGCQPVAGASLDIEHSRSSMGFTWEGFAELDEVSDERFAELLDDGGH